MIEEGRHLLDRNGYRLFRRLCFEVLSSSCRSNLEEVESTKGAPDRRRARRVDGELAEEAKP
jgi:hypothetical protein